MLNPLKISEIWVYLKFLNKQTCIINKETLILQSLNEGHLVS